MSIEVDSQFNRRLELARELHRRGVAANNVGRPVTALRLFRRAQQRLVGAPTDDDDVTTLRARLQISAAYSESEVNGIEAGLDLLRQVSTIVVLSDRPDLAVHVHLQRGFIHIRGGDLSSALEQLDAASDLIEYADAGAACNILGNRGALRLYLGDLALARTDLSQAAERSRREGLRVEEHKALHNLGYLEYLSGNVALALSKMDESIRLGPDVAEGAGLLDRARVLLAAGLHREAEEVLSSAAALFRAERLSQDVGEVDLARAECVLLAGDAISARRLAGRARDRFRRRRNDAWRRLAELVLLQADLADGRPPGRLVSPATRLALEFEQIGLPTQARTAQLIATEAMLLAGRADDAREAVMRFPAQSFDPIALRLYDLYVRARIALADSRPAAARRHVRNGLTELAHYQSSFASIDLQSGSAVHGRRLAELDIEMALGDGRPAALLEAVERGRATSNRLLPVQSPADEQSATLLAELRRTVEAARQAETAGASNSVAEKRRRVAELQRLLRARSWHADGSRNAARQPAKAGEVVAELSRQHAALACYVQVGDVLHLLSGGSDGLRMQALGSAEEIVELARRVRADLDVIANGRMPAQLASAIRASLRRSLAELDDRLIRPATLSDERVVVIPTGLLATLPWGSLPSLRGRPVVVAPSASTWLAASAARERPAAPDVAVFAGPGLSRSEEEAKKVGELWADSTLHTGEQARQSGLVAAMAAATIVHVAAHGEHQAENPLFSSIRLADGPVFAYEFDQTARSAEHVVLSACELGQATIRPGDEALGLTSVLLHLGTRSVVAGVARVHDDVAADVMIRYHAALAAGTDSARALAEACAAETELPAPFVCFGATWSR